VLEQQTAPALTDPRHRLGRARDRFWEAHRAEAAKIIARAAARGESSSGTDPDELIELLIGPALVRMIVSGRPLDATFASSVAAHVVAAFGGEPRMTDG
jgi:hypothetical protein